MSVATGSVSSTALPPAPPVPTDSVERERLIQSQLSRATAHMRVVDLGFGVLVWLAGALLLLIAAALFDHLIGLGRIGRCVALAALAGGSLWYLLLQVAPLLVRAINPAYAAKTIEEATPSLKNSLINFLLLRQDRVRHDKSGVREIVYQAVEKQAATDIAAVPVETTIDRSRLIYAGYVLCGVMAIFAAYKILSPKDPFQTVARVLAPWADIARPSRVEILDVQPGSTNIYYGQTVQVSATIRRLRTSDPVRVLYTTADGQIVDLPVELRRAAGDRFECTLPPAGDSAAPLSTGLQQNASYRLKAGDAETSLYRLNVISAPTIIVERLEYHYPAYTRKPPETIKQQGDIKALEGTKVTLFAIANQPIRSAWLELDPVGRDAAAEQLTLSAEGEHARGTLTLRLKDDRLTPWHSTYQVRFHNQRAEKSLQPIVHKIEVIRDLAPEVQIIEPARLRVEVPEDGELPIEVRAVDPDFGLSSLRLEGAAANRPPVRIDLLPDAASQPPKAAVALVFRPRDHQLKAGDELTYAAIAEDNRTSPQSGQPEANVARTKDYLLIVLPPQNKSPSGNQGQSKSGNQQPGANKEQPQPPNQQPNKQQQAGKQQNQQPAERSPEQPTNNNSEPSTAPPEQPQPNQANPQKPNENQKQQQSGQQQSGQQQSGQQQSGQQQDGQQQDGQQQSGQQQSGQQQSGQQGEGQSGGSGQQNSTSGQSANQSPGGAQNGSGAAGQPSGNQQPQATQDGQQQPNAGQRGENSDQQGKAEHDGQAIERLLEELKRRGQTPNQANDQQSGNQQGQSQDGQGQQGQHQQGRGQQGDGQHSPSSQQPSGNENASQPSSGQGAKSQSSGKSGSQNSGVPNSDRPEPTDASASKQQPNQQASQKGDPNNRLPGENQGASSAEQPGSASQGGAPQGPAKTDKGEKSSASKGEKHDGGAGKQGDEGAGQRANDKTGAGPGNRKNADHPKQQPAEGGKSEQAEPSPPSDSQRQSDSKGASSGDRSGGGKQGAGQSAGQKGNDSAGSQSAADQGTGKAGETGSGETGSKAGDGQKSAGKTGQAGQEPGQGSAQKAGDDQSGQAGPAQPGEGTSGKAKSPDRTKQQSGHTGGADPVGGSDDGRERSPPPATASEEQAADAANLEYARKATEMVLRRLKEEEHNPDPELLDKLGWTRDDLAEFLRRWDALQKAASQSPDGKRELDEAFKSLGLRDPNNRRRAGGALNDKQRGLEDAGNRSQAPPRYRDLFDAFRKAATRNQE